MYANAEDVKDYLYGIDISALIRAGANIDSLIARFLPLAQRELDQAIGQNMEQERLVDMRMDGPGNWDLALPHWPIQTLEKVEVVYGFHRLIYQFNQIRHTASKMLPAPYNQEGNTTPGDLFVDRDSGVMHVDLTGSLLSLASMPGTYPVWNVTFTAGQRDIIATYTHGFPVGSIPLDLQAALAMLVAIRIGEMALQRMTGGATMVRIGSVQRQWGNNKLGSMFSNWMGTIEDTIAYYSIKPLGGSP